MNQKPKFTPFGELLNQLDLCTDELHQFQNGLESISLEGVEPSCPQSTKENHERNE